MGTVPGQSICIPEKQAPDRSIALLLFIGTAFYLYLFRRCTSMDPDEGIVLQGAHRILRGEVLYRDFFSFFTPGSYYLLALLFKIFGDSLLVARTVLVFFGGVCSVITYLLARRACSRNAALFVACIVTLTTLPYRFLVLHNWDSTFWACLAVYCAVRFLESSNWKWALGLGSLTSFTFLFEQSKGAGLALGLCGGFIALALLEKRSARWRWREVLALTIGFGWPLFACLTYFGAHHALSQMVADWFWPMQHYSLANKVPYGYQNWSDNARHQMFGGPWGIRLVTAVTVSPLLLIPVLPLLAIGWLCYSLFQFWQRRASDERSGYYIVTSAALGGLLLSVVVVRADIVHFVYLQPLFFLVLAWLVDGRDIPGRLFRTIHPLINAYLAIAFLALAMPLLLRVTNLRGQVHTRRGTITVPKDDTVIQYVQAQVAPGETMLVYPYLPLYNYLTDTVSPSRYEYFQPGMNTPEQAREIISQLAAKHVRAVLLEPGFADKIPTSWPGTPVSAVVNDPIANAILHDYRSCRILTSPSDWIFLLMMRKDLPCPADPTAEEKKMESK
jgi:4-amino-4-deoxy-L-arabinose transferase-like glycosyltransferase